MAAAIRHCLSRRKCHDTCLRGVFENRSLSRSFSSAPPPFPSYRTLITGIPFYTLSCNLSLLWYRPPSRSSTTDFHGNREMKFKFLDAWTLYRIFYRQDTRVTTRVCALSGISGIIRSLTSLCIFASSEYLELNKIRIYEWFAIVTFNVLRFSRVSFYYEIGGISDFYMYLYMVKSYRNYRLIKYQKKG